MTDRLNEIFSNIEKVNTFADVGCDHGIITKCVLKSGKCKKAYITDVSEKCLKKAETLLSGEIVCGKVESFLTDGLVGVPEAELVLIAGMGGEEIIKILFSAPFTPQKLVLQPMKNADKVRDFIVNRGYRIVKDYVFYDKKFYDIIVAKRGEDSLSEYEKTFGRTNLRERSEAFISYLESEIKKADLYLKKELKEDVRAKITEKLELYKRVRDDNL